MCLNIEENAVFVADAHFNALRHDFSVFLQKVKEGEIKTSQLFLMGDMFDFITQESFYFIKQNQALIDTINELSQSIEMFYLEGNHDYNLERLFPNVQVIARENQPLLGTYDGKSVALSHGDNFENTSYNIYCAIIRNHPLLKFLNMIDFSHWLSKKIDYALREKMICRTYTGFDKKVQTRLENYNSDIVVEGHFHQGKEFEFNNKRYVNIPSLFCSKEYVVLQLHEFKKVALN
ncbi:UDP-2,3-diacylglucosamine diphosphatase [Candidatus Marinarcus aquaticus]|uniref:UDP-2,3-diacylglucosamine hydrolase n=1 Tax=Candidatus Marinarcus aquaticus TaxID=2044504 RepID=A0A4Q0XUJ5_9BACT|nr:metallophosphoesterase [Candidatus Marinarcus aquaticus]RXJ60615.1 UDP-2,3-diacylglucosamine hydrolase [Candidatus Marinarcus aquaticus]